MLFLVIPAVSYAAGWRAHTLTTPSMGRTAPVGSLVITVPINPARIHPTDVLAVHPPGRPHTTFIHRVISVTNTTNGLVFHTQGDINGSPDPWTVTPANIIGRAAIVIPDLGYLLRLLPLLLLGAMLTTALSLSLRPTLRTPVRILAASLLFAALITRYQPLTGLELIAQNTNGTTSKAAVVPTGMLPLRVQAVGGTHADLTPGQVGTLTTPHHRNGSFRITAATHLTGWWWLLTLTWTIPTAIAARKTRAYQRIHPEAHHAIATGIPFVGY
jgi:signal peptidase I